MEVHSDRRYTLEHGLVRSVALEDAGHREVDVWLLGFRLARGGVSPQPEQLSHGGLEGALLALLFAWGAHDGVEVDWGVSTKDVPHFEALVLLLYLGDDFLEGQAVGLDLPAVPESGRDSFRELDVLNISWLTRLHDRNRQVEEDVSMILLPCLGQDLDQLKCLQACNCGCRRGHGWHDTTSLELDLNPVHHLELVAHCSAVAHGGHEINVEVAVLILFELLGLDQGVCESLALARLLEGLVELQELSCQLLRVVDSTVLLLDLLLFFCFLTLFIWTFLALGGSLVD